MSIIYSEGMTRRFGDTIAVDRLNLTVERGEVFGFLGHNGAGKTTTVRLLNGVLTPETGIVRVLGLSPQTDGPALRARTGVLTETPSLDERLSARENLAIYAELYNVPAGEVARRVEDMLAVFDLADRGDEKVGGYSKGMKQRLALTRALLHQPELIFLDEPTSGLDPISTRQVHDMIQRLSREEGRTVFICTHNLNEAQRLCHRVAVMEHGHLMAVGTPAQLARDIGHGMRFEIEIAPSAVTETALKSAAGILHWEMNHDSVTVAVQDREAVPDLLAGLVSQGVRVYRVSPLEASLEDIYFALHGQKELVS